MRTISSTLMLFALLSTTAIGCADEAGSPMHRTNVPMGPGGASSADAPAAANVTVNGHLSSDGQGTVERGLGGARLVEVAKSVDVLALGRDGQLTRVDTVAVAPNGSFNTQLAPNASPTGIFILKVKDLAGAVVGAGVVNGLPAFVKAFAVDTVIDTATSFKAEILTTIAKKGVPGAQNLLNVLDAFVNIEVANTAALLGVFATDFDSIVGAAADAVIAAEDVIIKTLQQAGVPIDATELEKAQAAAVSGLQGLVTNATGQLVAGSKNLVTSLEAAAAKGAASIDDLLFNAIVNGGAAFASTFKKGTPAAPTLGFAATQSAFSVQTALTTGWAQAAFGQGGFSGPTYDAVKRACGDFVVAVNSAKSIADLEAAKLAFVDALLGKPQGGSSCILTLIAQALGDLTALVKDVEALVDPLAKDVASALATGDAQKAAAALAGFDAGTQGLVKKLEPSVGATGAASIGSTLRRVKKQVAL